MESCGEYYGNDDLYVYTECGTMREYSDLAGECKRSSDPYILTDCSNLFGWQHYFTDDLNKQYRRQLESCGEYYGYDDLYVYPECRTMRDHGDLGSDGEQYSNAYILTDCSNLCGWQHYRTVDLNEYYSR